MVMGRLCFVESDVWGCVMRSKPLSVIRKDAVRGTVLGFVGGRGGCVAGVRRC